MNLAYNSVKKLVHMVSGFGKLRWPNVQIRKDPVGDDRPVDVIGW